MTAATDVAHTLAGLSAAWRERRYDALASFLADDMVIALPALGKRLDGVAAAVDGLDLGRAVAPGNWPRRVRVPALDERRRVAGRVADDDLLTSGRSPSYLTCT